MLRRYPTLIANATSVAQPFISEGSLTYGPIFCDGMIRPPKA